MRVLLLIALILGPIASSAESRLIGTWRSDAERTIEFNANHNCSAPEQMEFINQLYGHLELTFTETTIRSRMPDVPTVRDGEVSTFEAFDETTQYRVIGEVDDSIAILSDEVDGRKCIQHFHFVGDDVMWTPTDQCMPTAANLREYFTRVDAAKQSASCRPED